MTNCPILAQMKSFAGGKWSSVKTIDFCVGVDLLLCLYLSKVAILNDLWSAAFNSHSTLVIERNRFFGFGQNRNRNPMGFGKPKPKLKPKLTPNIQIFLDFQIIDFQIIFSLIIWEVNNEQQWRKKSYIPSFFSQIS